VGERWTLHIVLALMSGPKRYSQLKQQLTGAGANILSDRLARLSENQLVGRATGTVPGSQTTYHLTEQGRELAPVVEGLTMWGLHLLLPAQHDKDHDSVAFDQAWAPGATTTLVDESYQWSIDGVEFELAVKGCQLIRTAGRATQPAVTFKTSSSTLGAIYCRRTTVAEAIEQGEARLRGSRTAFRRMFGIVGFPSEALGL
jgi:DNA-binding HxlR family transcriptional regulator